MNKEELKQMWDNLFKKLNEEEITFLAVANNEKNKEIERLKKEKQELEEIINIRECQLEEMQESKTDYTQVNILEMKIERLNNIINELEKWLVGEYDYLDENVNEDNIEMITYKRTLDKLKELKGSDKNE